MSRRLAWTQEAWIDYLYWQRQDCKTLGRINRLIEASPRKPFSGLGRLGALKANLLGFWSRRIDAGNRLVYAVERDLLMVISCRFHC